MWYDLAGNPITAMQANELLAENRTVARTMITTDKGQVTVSTVHLVLNHGWDSGPPVLWETMVFEGPCDGAQTRYRSLDAAIAGHEEEVTLCRAALDLDGARIVAEERHDGPANLRAQPAGVTVDSAECGGEEERQGGGDGE